MRKLALVLFVLLLLTTAIPTGASPPQQFAWDRQLFDCAPFGYNFAVWRHSVGHLIWSQQLDLAGNLVSQRMQWQGKNDIYLSTNPSVYVATSPFAYTEHVEVLQYDPSLVEVRTTGTIWNLKMPGHPDAVLHLSGQWVNTFDRATGTLVEPLKRVGREVANSQAICAALAE